MIDHTLINVLAGQGGSGAVAFRREKYVPFGGPSGGDGGEGGSVFIKANSQRATLEEFTAGKIYKAGDGQNGKNKNKTGLSGKDLEIKVPVGTVVKWKHMNTGEDGSIDLDKEGDSLLVAQGGQGGKGNAHFATSTNRAPRLAESGEKGENLEIVLDLKLLADVGLVGQPNAGKSSFLARTTGANPKIGGYPFTTLEPNLGVVNVGWATFILADIPGLIEGSHDGKGLGDQFLRHVERTSVLVHIIDGSLEDLAGSWKSINMELQLYSPELLSKPQIVFINKLDMPEVQLKKDQIPIELKGLGIREIYMGSAVSGEGLEEVMRSSMKYVDEAKKQKKQDKPSDRVILRPKPERITPVVEQVQPGVWRVIHEKAERLVGGGHLSDMVLAADIWRELGKFGVVEELERSGASSGDTIFLGEMELIWR